MRLPALLLLPGLLGTPAPSAAIEPSTKGTEQVLAIFTEDGRAYVRWTLPDGPLPESGFRVERSAGGGPRTSIATVSAADPTRMRALPPEGGRAVQRFVELSRDPASREGEGRKAFLLARFLVEAIAIGDPKLAEALGLSVWDPSPPPGQAVTYRVVALFASGERELGISAPVLVAPMPKPSPPADLRARPDRAGVRLFWSPAPKDQGKNWEAAAFQVLRRDAPGSKPAVVSQRPVLFSTGPDSSEPLPAFQDPTAPAEKRLFYSVIPVDLAGRRGAESSLAEVFQPDFAALDPPSDLSAKLESGRISLTWKGPENPNRAGWRVERAANPNAIGEALTPKPLEKSSFTDTTARRGSSYYYRVSAVNRRGEVGAPSLRAAVTVRDTKSPAPPTGLVAERKTGRVVLRWSPPAEEVAGFQVERSLDGREWAVLTSRVSAEPRFEDTYPRETAGTLRYRVRSWSHDDVPSEPSPAIAVELPDRQPPAPPVIERVDGTGGKASLQFRPAGPKGEVERFYVLRSLRADAPGAVVDKKGMPASARTFTDVEVEAGTSYTYRLVAVDPAGNRSDPSEGATVRVAPGPLPTPPVPKARFEAKPWPRVVLEFPAAPASVRWVVERRERSGRWLVVQGPLPREATRALDVNPPRGATAAYRLSALGANGEPGPSSDAVEIAVPRS
jgi:hypothetical protein